MTQKQYIATTLLCKRKGGAKVSIIWTGSSTAAVVDTETFRNFLDTQLDLTFELSDVQAFLAKNSRAKNLAVTGLFAVDELFLMLLNLEYSIYPDKIARHELYLPEPGSSLAITVLAEGVDAGTFSPGSPETIDFAPEPVDAPSCSTNGCVSTWHAPKPSANCCDAGCAQPCHVISIAYQNNGERNHG